MKEKLTVSQALVMDCICQFINENGYSPTVRELCKKARMSSTSSIHAHLKHLKEKGYINYVEGKNRTIVITDKQYFKNK